MTTLKSQLKILNLKTAEEFRQYLGSHLVNQSKEDQKHHTNHRTTDDVREITRLCSLNNEDDYKLACVLGITDSILEVAEHTPTAIKSIGHYLELLTRHHPTLRGQFVDSGVAILPALTALSPLAANELACHLIACCASVACINKIKIAAVAIPGSMVGCAPYEATRLGLAFERKLKEVTGIKKQKTQSLLPPSEPTTPAPLTSVRPVTQPNGPAG